MGTSLWIVVRGVLLCAVLLGLTSTTASAQADPEILNPGR